MIMTIAPVSVQGTQLVTCSQGQCTRFYIKGVSYQPTANGMYTDVISDDQSDLWMPDLTYFSQLGVNVLRVYESDPAKSHSKFMTALEKLGIYVLFDIPCTSMSIDRNKPSYDVTLFEYFRSKILHFGAFDNTLGFLIGNEVINTDGPMVADIFVKASLRDMKRVIARELSRPIPVGYAAVDGSGYRKKEMQYMSCGPVDSQVDMYGVNAYSWCSPSDTMSTSGYDVLVKEFSELSVPAFFSEFGCNVNRPREWSEVKAMFSDQMTSVFSGGVAYEYSEETNAYGLIKIDGSSRVTFADFKNLQNEYSNFTHSTSALSNVRQQQQEKTCNLCQTLPPTPSSAVSTCIQSDLGCQISHSDLNTTAMTQQIQRFCGQAVDCPSVLESFIEKQSSSNAVEYTFPVAGSCDLATKVVIAARLYFESKSNVVNWKDVCESVGGLWSGGYHQQSSQQSSQKVIDQCYQQHHTVNNSGSLTVITPSMELTVSQLAMLLLLLLLVY